MGIRVLVSADFNIPWDSGDISLTSKNNVISEIFWRENLVFMEGGKLGSQATAEPGRRENWRRFLKRCCAQ